MSCRRLYLAVGILSLAFLDAAALAGEAVCPLPAADVDKAVRAFSAMSTVFQDPRCTNCHGAVNPFAADGGHAGGKITLDNTLRPLGESRAALVEALTRANGAPPNDAAIADAEAALRTFRSTDGPLTDRAAIQDILKLGGLEEVASAACAECHQNSPARWRLATSLWAGKSEEELCEFFQKTMDVSGFLQHITEDQSGFIPAGFRGDRGLNAFGKGFLKQETGRDFTPMPPKGLSAAAFVEAANRWIDGLGGEFHKPPSCGCSVKNYRLTMKGEVDIRVAGGAGASKSKLEQAFDLAFAKEGRFSGQASRPVSIVNTMNAGGASCRTEITVDQVLDIAGRVDEKSSDLTMTLTSNGQSRPSVSVCVVAGRRISTPVPATKSDQQVTSWEMPAEVDRPKTVTIPFGGAGQFTGEMVVQRR